MKTEPGRLHPDVRIGHIHLKVADLEFPPTTTHVLPRLFIRHWKPGSRP